MVRYVYRCTINGTGIYEALKKEVGFRWKEIKEDPRITWLPQPTVEYGKNHLSYFTERGYNYFISKTRDLIKEEAPQLLNKIDIHRFEQNEIIGKIVYSDKYQIVTEVSEKEIIKEIIYERV